MDKVNTFLVEISPFLKKNDIPVIISRPLLRKQLVQERVTCLEHGLSVGKTLGHMGGVTTVYDVVSKEVV